MGSIYLIRHGQASFGSHDYDVLSELGVRQAQLLGEHLAQLGVCLNRCISGNLRRQQDTALTALAALGQHGQTPELEIDPAFNEFNADAVIASQLPELLKTQPQALEIMRRPAEHRAEFQRLFALMVERWTSGAHQAPGLQSWQEFVAQVQDGLQRILTGAPANQHVALVTSGGTITALLHLLTGMCASQAFALNWQIVNTSLSRLKFRGNEAIVASFNSYSHLELLKIPELITYR